MNKQLFEKQANSYKPIYPLVRLEDIIDTISDKSIQWILNNYNHIYVEYSESVAVTRNKVPTILRRTGLWISYNAGTEVVTEYYKGNNKDVTNFIKWTNDDNWERFDKIKHLDGSITYQHLSESLRQLIGQGNNITNFPDDEDLEVKDGLLKLKDRDFEPNNFSGLGRVILRKNIKTVDGQPKNVLTQDMINKSNTIYEIRYDFDLNGAEITIPEGCVLDFQGGSFSNGTIVGNNTAIQASLVKIFGLDIELTGTWNVEEAYPEWFGAKHNGVYDDTISFQCCLNFAGDNINSTNKNNKTRIKLQTGIYCISTVYLRTGVYIIGNGKFSTIIKPLTDNYVFDVNDTNHISRLLDVQISNLMISPNGSFANVSNYGKGINLNYTSHININNIFFTNLTVAINQVENYDSWFTDVDIMFCGDNNNSCWTFLHGTDDVTNAIHINSCKVENCSKIQIGNGDEHVCREINFVLCKFEGNQLDIYGASNISLSSCHFTTSDKYSINIDNSYNYNIIINGCTFTTPTPNKGNYIYANEGNTIISNCSFYAPLQAIHAIRANICNCSIFYYSGELNCSYCNINGLYINYGNAAKGHIILNDYNQVSNLRLFNINPSSGEWLIRLNGNNNVITDSIIEHTANSVGIYFGGINNHIRNVRLSHASGIDEWEINNNIEDLRYQAMLANIGDTPTMPSRAIRSTMFFTNRKILHWNGGAWVTADGKYYLSKDSGDSQERPTNYLYGGHPYFDTTLGKPIWYNGSKWVDATGVEV